MLWTDWVSNSPPTKTWTAIADGAEADGVVDVDRDLLVRELLEDARAAAGPEDEALLDRRRDDGAEDAAGEHQRVGVRDERQDVEVDPLEAGRRALEVAVVDRQHDRPAALRPEDPGEPVLHPPVVGAPSP